MTSIRIRECYLWACERLYHELAPAYDLVSRGVSAGAWPQWRRLALAHVAVGPLLEIGFGTGELLAELAAAGRDVTGLELSPAMHAVTAARLARLARQGLTAPRVQAQAQAMPLAAASFATVLSTFPAPYILQAETLRECRRVLRAGGRLVVTGLWVRLASPTLRALPPVFYADPAPAQLEAITRRVAEAGFRVTLQWEQAGWAELPILVGEAV